MDDQEFRSLLDLFPIVRSRDHRADLDSSKQSTSQSIVEREQESKWHDAPSVDNPKDLQGQNTDPDKFWEKLKTAALSPLTLFNRVDLELDKHSFRIVIAFDVGEVEAERFCKAFEKLHKKLVYEELDREAAKRYLLNS